MYPQEDTAELCLPPLQCDQVMEFSWSALWNITDETPDNCEMFLNFNGMKLFLDCLKVGGARAATPPPQASRGHTGPERKPCLLRKCQEPPLSAVIASCAS